MFKTDLTIDGNLEIGAHVWSEIDTLSIKGACINLQQSQIHFKNTCFPSKVRNEF